MIINNGDILGGLSLHNTIDEENHNNNNLAGVPLENSNGSNLTGVSNGILDVEIDSIDASEGSSNIFLKKISEES